MAMFSGHILNGTTEILVGLYWLYNLLWRFLLGRREEELLRDGHGRKFRSALAFPSRWCPSFPVVPTLMCCVLTIGFIGMYTFRFRPRRNLIISRSFSTTVNLSGDGQQRVKLFSILTKHKAGISISSDFLT